MGNIYNGLLGGAPPVQALGDISATKQDKVGKLIVLDNGQKFRYCKAGAVALAAGKMCQSAVKNMYADGTALAIANASVANGGRLGDKFCKVTLLNSSPGGGAMVLAENELVGGYLIVDLGTGLGHKYLINGNNATVAAGECTVYLEDDIRVAFGDSATATLSLNPYYGTIIHDSPMTAMMVGVPLVPVTANYYYWSQTGGVGCCLQGAAWVTGIPLYVDGSVDGALTPSTETLYGHQVAIAMRVGTNASYGDCKFIID